MKKGLKLLTAAAIAVLAVSCSSAQKMVDEANNVKVTCNPAVLEAVAGNVDADLNITYPESYFLPKATLEVTPVLVYDGGEAKSATLNYQGQKVKDNYKVVSKDGGSFNEKVHFDYVDGMQDSHLELRGVVKYKGKSYKLPTRKVADGVNTTYMLVDKGIAPLKADGYQAILKQTAEGQILYNINSADVRSKELKGQSIQDFRDALDEIKSNERKTLVGTEVVAYASPDGGQELNQKLSDRRSESADKAWDKVMKDKDVADPEVKSVGQDWEGFQELVQNSDIEDKDLILRVLSMYSDPAVRESEIKNMSDVYTDLKTSVLPELRRARFIANVEYKNYTSEELLKLVDENSDVLDETALLHAATLVEDEDTKVKLYNKAIDKYDSDVARYNLAATYLANDEVNKAEKALADVENKDDDYENALGVLEVKKGNYDEAVKHFKNSESEAAKANLGVVDILEGNYSKAANELSSTDFGYDKALAYTLNGQYDKAMDAIDCDCAKANYLRAVIAARQGKASDVQTYLNKVKEQDKDLYERAATDIEFAEYNK